MAAAPLPAADSELFDAEVGAAGVAIAADAAGGATAIAGAPATPLEVEVAAGLPVLVTVTGRDTDSAGAASSPHATTAKLAYTASPNIPALSVG